jgi:hypothetical protein
MSRPTYVGPGSTSALPGPAYNSPGRHITLPAGIYFFLAGIRVRGPAYSEFGLLWPAYQVPGPVPAGSGWASGGQTPAGPASGHPARPSRFPPAWAGSPAYQGPWQGEASSAGWAGSSFIPAGPSRPSFSRSTWPSRPPQVAASAGHSDSPS